ncbi:MAG: S-layer homology domain-containing protein [Bacillota bacterium]|nr:S-layer homology domain-containing protein [Bacillota bacterium]
MTHKKQKKVSLLLSIALMLTGVFSSAASEKEVPEAVYSGIDNASVLLKNIDYTDVKNSDTWAKEAIYETGALGIMKGYGNRSFGLTQPVTKEQAIAAAYRIVGREADAQKAAEALDNARAAANKKKNAINMWSDGYLQLAANEGLITKQALTDALNADQTTLIPGTSFYRSNRAQRQEIGDWMAKTLKLDPVYGQDNIFNSFNDWSMADPIKIPYLEAMLKNNIMNGTGNGSFNPTGTVTREQTAQIIKNAENIILPILKYDKKMGTIEDIKKSVDSSMGDKITTNTYNIRNSNGKLHKVDAQYLTDAFDNSKNEQVGTPVPGAEKDFIVYKDGKIGKNDLLSLGDRVEYIVAPDNTIRFMNVVSSVNDTKYVAAQVNSVDPSKLTMNVTTLLNLDYPNLDSTNKGNIANSGSGLIDSTLRYSNNAKIRIDGKPATIDQIKPDLTFILTIKNNMVTDINSANLTLNGDTRIVRGVVEENNPQLGYITLYGENGDGVDPSVLNALRTFNYINPNGITVNKNHKKADIEDIEPGDSVFMKLDAGMNVYDISAADNYTNKYAKVISRKPSSIAVEFEDGTQQVLPVDDKVTVVSNNEVVGLDKLKDGDRIKLLLNQTNKNISVKGITVSDSQKPIKNIYKGKLVYIDDTSNDLVLQNVEKLDKGQWERADSIGISKIRLGDDYKLYSDNKAVEIEGVNKNLKNQEAYIASQSDYGGGEKAAVVTFRNKNNLESMIDDTISNNEASANKFGLTKNSNDFTYGPGTIIVKDDRLVLGNSISSDDAAYIVANRDNDSGDYLAGIVQLNERIDPNAATIYRGRIKAIDDNKSFEVESFSQLKGQNWEYVNTPKTFKITYDTKILTDKGLIAQRDFTGYGDKSFIGSSVYIMADNINAVLVSTAPYGPDGAFAKGRVVELSGGSAGDDGKYLTEPTGVMLRDAKIYDVTNHIWADSKDITLNLLKNSIIIKNKKEINPSEINKNDTLRIYKKGKTETGDAYIVIVDA